MNDQTRAFLREKFAEYYSGCHLSMPPGLSQREFGFIFHEESVGVAMRRHKSFNTERELTDYLRGMPPAHAYHSAAYYKHPQAPTMQEKDWLGADLIFDLDADHLPGVKNMTYGQMLDNVQKEIKRLIDEFLIDDMGFRERDLSIVFSGGRGYHVHVRDERVKTLKSPERREIVDYLLGTGLDLDHVFIRTTAIVEGQKGARTTGVWRIRGFTDAGGYGWNRRLARYVADRLEEMGRKEDKEAKENLRLYGLDSKTASAVLKKIRDPGVLGKIRNQGLIELTGNIEGFLKNMLAGTIDQFKVDVAGKTDEPVTADIKRLIRLPGSLHGGTSFKVMPLTRADLDNFNPLENAIHFSDSPVRVLVTRPAEVELKGKIYRVSEGVGRLPENVAMFLMCRGSAEYEP